MGHERNCKAKNIECRNCGEKGLFARICKTKVSDQKEQIVTKKKVNVIRQQNSRSSSEESGEEVEVLHIDEEQ